LLVTLDSNVWEKMMCPDDVAFQTDPKIFIYKELNQFIGTNQIQFVLSGTVFSLEGIRKGERQTFFAQYKPDFQVNESWDSATGVMHLQFSIGPNDASFPVLNPYLKERGEIAFKAGFKIIQLPRVGMPTDPMTKPYLLSLTNEKNEKISLVSMVIEQQLHAGYFWIQKLFQKYQLQDIFTSIQDLPKCEDKAIAKAVAEWADGDSIATHIGYGGDYFCTNDQGGNAGTNSVMHPDNILALRTQFNLDVVSPEELLRMLKGIIK
jgi:hypothetical protein